MILILGVLLISFCTKAQSITFTNNTCSVIKLALFCSDQTWTSCGAIQSNVVTVGSGGGITYFPSPASLGYYYDPQTNTTINYTLNGTATFDAMKVGADDNQGCIEYLALGNCGLSQTYTGSCHFCGGNALQVTWTVTSGNTVVTFDN